MLLCHHVGGEMILGHALLQNGQQTVLPPGGKLSQHGLGLRQRKVLAVQQLHGTAGTPQPMGKALAIEGLVQGERQVFQHVPELVRQGVAHA